MTLGRTLPLVLLLAGCGSLSLVDQALPGLPAISTFTANPAALGPGGGLTVLSWTVVNEDALSLEPGIGTITGYTSANLSLSVTTTYKLTASNSLGPVSSTLTVQVGP